MKTETLNWLKSAAHSVQRIKLEFSQRIDNFKRLTLLQLYIRAPNRDDVYLLHGNDYWIAYKSHVLTEDGKTEMQEIKIPLTQEEFELLIQVGFEEKK